MKYFFYKGQNTGGTEQKFILGNKDLYQTYEEDKDIFFFKDFIYKGKVKIVEEPYKENGEWIFPLQFIIEE